MKISIFESMIYISQTSIISLKRGPVAKFSPIGGIRIGKDQ